MLKRDGQWTQVGITSYGTEPALHLLQNLMIGKICFALIFTCGVLVPICRF